MRNRHRPSALACVALAAIALAPAPLTPAAAAQQEGAANNPAAEPTDANEQQPPRIRFAFKNTPLDQVVDFFARESGLPVIEETDIPAGTVTFISDHAYPLPEALRVLNTILRTRGLLLRRDAEFLYLGKVGDMQKAPVPTFENELPNGVNGEEIVTLVIPLKNASATPVADNLKGLIGDYGSIVAMPNQNTVVLTESAAQIRRLKSIIESLDDEPPYQEAVRVFKLEHIDATAALESLKVLVAEKQVTVVFDKQGNRQVVEDENIAGVRLEADERTNSVIALGSEARLSTVEELIEIIDQPEDGGARREMITFTLAESDPNEIAANLRTLYEKLPDDRRPTILPLPTLGKLTVIGPAAALTEAADLVAEIDGTDAAADNQNNDTTRRSRVVPIDHADPASVSDALDQLLSTRQRRALRYARLPGREALMLVGPARDVTAASELIASIDTPAQQDKQIRVVRLDTPDPLATAERADELYRQSTANLAPAERGELTWSFDADASSVVITADRRAMPRFTEALERAKQLAPPERTTRIIDLQRAQAAELLPELKRLLEQTASADTARDAPTPQFTVVEATNSLVVTAEELQHRVIRDYVSRLDVAQPTDVQPLRLFQLRAADANNIARLLRDQYNARPQQQRLEQPVDISADANTNTLIVAAHPAVVPDIESFIADINDAASDDADRVTEIFPLKVAKAQDLARAMQSLYPEPPMPRDRRGRPMPWLQEPREVNVSADAASNSLIVDAPAERMPAFKALVDKLDRVELPPQAELRTYKVDREDLPAITRTLQSLASNGSLARPAETSGQRVRVTVESEPQSGTLIVGGDATTHQIVERLLADLATDTPATPTQLLFFDLQNARADRIQPTVAKLLNARLQALADEGAVQRPADGGPRAEVTADDATNTLIITAPDALAETAREIVARLDTPAARTGADVVRVVKLDFADASDAAPALQRSIDAADLPSGGEVSISASRGSRALIVAGVEEDVGFVEQLVADLDQPPADDRLEVRTVYLENNRAETVAGVVEQVLGGDELPSWWIYNLRRAGQDTGERMQVKVAAEPRANAVVITAAPELIAVAEELVKQLDAPANQSTPERPVRIIRLANADAQNVADNLSAVLADDPSAGATLAPTVRVDAPANALIARGTPEQLQRIQELATELDSAAMVATRELRSILVDRSRTDAAALAETIRGLLDRQGVPVRVISADELRQSLPSQSTPPDKPEEPADDADRSQDTDERRSNGAILLPERLRFILKNFHQTVVAQADQTTEDPASEPADDTPDDPAPEAPAATTSIDLTSLLAEARSLLDEQRAAEQTTDRPADQNDAGEATTNNDTADTPDAEDSPPTEPEPITLAVDPRTNRLVVLGSARLTERIANLARDLQAELPPEPSTIRIVKLPDPTDPNTVANLLRATLAQLGRASDNNPSGTTGRVAVIPDRSSSSVIVAANDTDFDTVSQIITALADPGQTEQLSIRAFPLTNVRADLANRSLNSLLSPRRGAGPDRGQPVELSVTNDEGDTITATIPFGSVTVTPGPSQASLIVSGPARAFPVIGRFVEIVDKSPSADTGLTRLYTLDNADARNLGRTIRNILRNDRQRARYSTAPAAVFDDQRTNTLIVTASTDQHNQIESLIARLDRSVEEDAPPLEVIPVSSAAPSALARIINATVVGDDRGRESRVSVTADDTLNVLLVRAPDEERAEIDALLKELDRPDVAELPVRSVKLERADANVVAAALERFFRDRARASTNPGQRRKEPRVAVAGDARTGTLLVAASDEDFAVVQELIETFDAPGGTDELEFKIIQLENALVGDIIDTVRDLANELTRRNVPWMRGGNATPDQVIIRENPRTNSIIVLGSGEFYDTIESIVSMLDTPEDAAANITARVFRVPNGDLNAIQNAATEALGDPDQRWWMPTDPTELRFSTDDASRSIIAIGPADKVERAGEFIERIASQLAGPDQGVESVELAFADAGIVANNVNRFFQNRARIAGQRTPAVSAIGSRRGTVLLLTGDREQLPLAADIASRFDQPEDAADERTIEIFTLAHADPRQIARAVRDLFPRSRTTGRQPVVATPDLRTGSLVVSAPNELFPEVQALVKRLDTPNQDETVTLRTFTLETARAEEVARTLTETLNLDNRGRPVPGANGEIRRFIGPEGEPVRVAANITPDERSNTLLVSADEQSLAVIENLIEQLDDRPAVSPTEYRTFKLRHALAGDAASRIRELLRGRRSPANAPAPNISADRENNTILVAATADQLAEIQTILDDIDTPPDTERRTEFVKLEVADAQQVRSALSVFFGPFASAADTPGARNVRITADTTTNSLVISAAEDQWPRITQLIDQLDNAAYDPSRRLEVIPLQHADAASVADAIQTAFDRPVEARLEAERQRNERERRNLEANPFYLPSFTAPDTLVEAEEIISVAAEPITNSLIVSAGARDLERIREIIDTLDVPGSAGLPTPAIIPIRNGRADEIAGSLRQFYETNRRDSRRSVAIAASQSANAIIVRAPEDELAEIRRLADSLAEGSQTAGVAVRTLRLNTQPATRLAQTLSQTFAPKAQLNDEPLTITADARTNALVVTSSKRLFDELTQVVRALDPEPQPAPDANPDNPNPNDAAVPTPGPGQSLKLITLEHTAPRDAAEYLRQLGLTSQQPLDRPGIVGEPINPVPVPEQNALAVLAQPADMPAVEALLNTLDRPAASPNQRLRIIRLKTAAAEQVAQALRRTLDAARADAGAGLAAALAEQVRRLNLRGTTATAPDINIDLTKPIRIDPEPQSNALIIASTPANVRALAHLIELLDTLPQGDAVLIRIFHLENGSAQRTAAIVRELFQQGEALRRAPGTNIQGLPTTETGRALAGEIAVSTDDRTNALVVAGREEAVALAEVLINQLDAAENDNWIEPRIIRLRHADPTRLAETLNTVLVQGLGDTPDSIGLQRQIGRLRYIQRTGKLDQNAIADIRADRFAPLTSLVILPEDALNAIIAVGSPSNLDLIEALVDQLDVRAASRDALVRLYPLEHAAADRVAELLQRLFRQQISADNLREQDALAVEADNRTNTLVVATSPRSFAIVENLLDTLDTPDLNPTVSIAVIPVQGAPADELAPRIERLMQQRLRANAAGEPSPRDVVSIQAAEASNALIVAASKDNLAIVRDLVQLLAEENASGGAESVEVIPLASADAEQMADTLDELYVEKTNQTRGSRNAVRVRPDTRLNAVVASGTPQDIEELRRLVRSLDGQRVSAVREIRRFGLDSANALEMTNLINNILTGRGGRTTQRQATIIRFVRTLVDGTEEASEAEISRAIRERISLEPDLRTNTVVVSAPPNLMLLIESLIEDIDSSAEGARNIRTFELQNADAENMRDLLIELFNLEQQGNLFVLVPAGENADDPNADPDDLTFSTVPDQRQQLSITVDLRTNSLLVSGSDTYLTRVSEIIRQLDAKPGTQREQITYELKNARVEEVADALQQFIQIEQERIARLLGPDRTGSLQRRLEREISVVGVPGSSRLILSASPRYMERVRSLVDELDTPPKQVLIQVLIAEVTLDSEDTFGIDAGFMDAGSRDYGGNYTALGTPLATALGVPNLSVTSLDFEVFVRALQVQGRLEVLSRPQILVNDNQLANIQVGEQIQLVENVERLDDGRTVSDVTPRDLGVILNVEPSISPDNSVRLDIAPEISTLTNRTTQVSTDFEAPVISQRSAETTVTVRDGETIVIGGLIESSIDVRTSKVPVIGDIPLVGELFKSRNEDNRRTELLILLTPRVIVNPEDIRRYSDIEVNRLSLPETTKDQLRRNDVGLDTTSFANPGAEQQGQGTPADDDPKRPRPRPTPDPTRAPEPEEEYDGFELPL